MTEEAATKVKGRKREHMQNQLHDGSPRGELLGKAYHILPIEPHARKRSRWQAG
jgi:hypothetical protein